MSSPVSRAVAAWACAGYRDISTGSRLSGKGAKAHKPIRWSIA
jgi:hypothetical protein